MEDEIRPSTAETEFLNLAYNRFYDIYEEVFEDSFMEKDPYYRYSTIKDAFSIYSELLNYGPIKDVIDLIKTKRPPMEAELGSEFTKFIRNIFSHFPFFKQWDELYISKSLTNWYKEGLSIDRFLAKYVGHNEIKYRFWEPKKKLITYISIRFPSKYDLDSKIYLKDILNESDGVKFSLILMKQVMDTQVEEVSEK